LSGREDSRDSWWRDRRLRGFLIKESLHRSADVSMKFSRLLSRSASRSRQAARRDWRSRSSRAFCCASSTCPARSSSTEASFPRSSTSIEAASLNKSAYPPAKSSSAVSTAPRRNTPSSRSRPSTSRATLTNDAAESSSNATATTYSPNEIPTNWTGRAVRPSHLRQLRAAASRENILRNLLQLTNSSLSLLSRQHTRHRNPQRENVNRRRHHHRGRTCPTLSIPNQ
jgi:hypothetical protein